MQIPSYLSVNRKQNRTTLLLTFGSFFSLDNRPRKRNRFRSSPGQALVKSFLLEFFNPFALCCLRHFTKPRGNAIEMRISKRKKLRKKGTGMTKMKIKENTRKKQGFIPNEFTLRETLALLL